MKCTYCKDTGFHLSPDAAEPVLVKCTNKSCERNSSKDVPYHGFNVKPRPTVNLQLQYDSQLGYGFWKYYKVFNGFQLNVGFLGFTVRFQYVHKNYGWGYQMNKAIMRAKFWPVRFWLWMSWKNKVTYQGYTFHYRWCLGKYLLFMSYTNYGDKFTGPV